jgi:putative spermidine/putrescine transport system substrate-binding protein
MKTLNLFGATLILGSVLAQPVFAESTITLNGYSGLFQELFTKAVVQPFMASHPDIKVEYFPFQSSAAILGTLRAQKSSPQADVAIMDMSVAKTGTDEGLLDKIDATVSQNVNDLYPEARFDNVAGVGLTFDNLVMIYNTTAIKDAPTSWMDLADSKYKGKVGFLSAPDLGAIGLTVILDHVAGGKDPLLGVDKGIEAMAKIAPNIQTWEPKPEIYPLIVSGQVSLGMGWNARAQANADSSNGRLAVSLPKEGTILQINTINLVKGAPGSAAAKTFVDYTLSPIAQKAFTEAMYYAPTNKKAQIAPSVIDRTVVKVMDKTIPLDWIKLAPVRDTITDQWRRRVIPLSR